jgi:putative colanic acid biosysnthesis UDP-glucose lipid carrier transferase
MAQPVFVRNSLPVALITTLQHILPAVVIVAALVAIASQLNLYFDDALKGLIGVTLLLTMLALRSSTGETPEERFSPAALITGVFVRWSLLCVALIVIGYFSGFGKYVPRRLILPWMLVSPFLASAVLLLLQRIRREVELSITTRRRVAIIGVTDVSLSLAHKLAGFPELNSTVLGFFDDRGHDRLPSLDAFSLIGKLPDVASYCRRENVDVIYISLPIRHVERVMNVLEELKDSTASIYYVPDIFVFDLIQSRTADIRGIPVVAMCETPFYGYRGVVKRIMDVLIAASALIVLAPVMAGIALLVKLTSAGPAIFKQRRYGLDGQEIRVYKFRSMRTTEDGQKITQASQNDPRITGIGRILRKYSLDELPQFFNVLQGRMSVVGPRPHAVAHNEQYRGLIKGYMLRHKVLPGITGLAQVSGCRGETRDLAEMQARVTYDLEYLRRWTPGLDLRILVMTAMQVLRSKKAY